MLDRFITHFCLIVEGVAVLVGTVGAVGTVAALAVAGVDVMLLEWLLC